MADQKVTKMVMKVNLKCDKCFRKIKKVLCCYPQIQDQVYDEKQNTVTITVVCCSPEKIMAKIVCKAGDTIECIKILPPPVQPPPPPELQPLVVQWWCYCCCCCHKGGPCCYVNHCCDYFSEENASGCSIM